MTVQCKALTAQYSDCTMQGVNSTIQWLWCTCNDYIYVHVRLWLLFAYLWLWCDDDDDFRMLLPSSHIHCCLVLLKWMRKQWLNIALASNYLGIIQECQYILTKYVKISQGMQCLVLAYIYMYTGIDFPLYICIYGNKNTNVFIFNYKSFPVESRDWIIKVLFIF